MWLCRVVDNKIAVQKYLILAGILAPVCLVLYFLVPYSRTIFRQVLQYLALGAQYGKKFAWVDYAYKNYGNLVRAGDNHVSIAEPEGRQTVDAHGNGFLKDHFYEAFVSGLSGVFNVRDRAEHTRKHDIVAHAFSPGADHGFETHGRQSAKMGKAT
ncbi:hypothetical protein AC579_7414 [Pseudocercospora musae]|uniref:Cytochrome P450 n=1 Tax=Pseudocercospora musae TaxID=113226 RepID=A0A139IR17_9PEZI|nr:hypothetical protein AC579_7414 [Pseudocercospora musae]